MQKSNVGAISSKNKCNLVTRVGAISLFSVMVIGGGGTSRVRAAIFLVEQMQPSSFCPLIAPLFPLHLPQISAKSINYLLSYALTPYFYGTEGGIVLCQRLFERISSRLNGLLAGVYGVAGAPQFGPRHTKHTIITHVISQNLLGYIQRSIRKCAGGGYRGVHFSAPQQPAHQSYVA